MTYRTRRFLIPLLALAGAACEVQRTPEDSETWGFVATLGNDTTSVERVTRSGNRIFSDAIGRSPFVVRRRWEATLGLDGSVERWTMDTHIPNAPPGEQHLHHEMESTGGVLRLVRQTGSDTAERRVRNPYERTLPWNAYVYATYEMLFQAARELPDTARIGHYFFEGWSEGNLGYARVAALDDGRVSITSTGLSGTGVAELDEAGRMTSYSGAGTTYKQEVRRVADVPDLDALFERFTADERARGLSRSLSVRDTARGAIGGATIEVDYGRPLARGRELVGGIIPYDRVWRTGANAATQLTTRAPVRLAGVPLDAGTYTLWTLPSRGGVQLIINAETGQWGTGYKPQHDIARAAMQVEAADAPVEQFTIRVDEPGARLVMEWGPFRWSAPIEAR